jgi:hypothetical protein
LLPLVPNTKLATLDVANAIKDVVVFELTAREKIDALLGFCSGTNKLPSGLNCQV